MNGSVNRLELGGGATAYWQAVRKVRLGLNRDLLEGKYPGQPTEFDEIEVEIDGAISTRRQASWCWLTSNENIVNGTRAGVVVSATLAHAARCIAGMTHRVSTEREIQDELDRQLMRKLDADTLDIRLKVKREAKETDLMPTPVPLHLEQHSKGKQAKAKEVTPAAV